MVFLVQDQIKCYLQSLGCFLEGEGHSEVSIVKKDFRICFELLNSLQPSLIWLPVKFEEFELFESQGSNEGLKL